jgi:Major tropism determinant N-terminal domain
MAIVQISQIKNRRGLSEDLPQLASAELGWSIDTQELYIGNGTVEEGAPEVGNTRLLTENDLPYANTSVLINNTTANIAGLTFTTSQPCVTMNYAIQRASDYRQGTILIAQNTTSVSYTDTFTETANIGVILTFTQSSNISTTFTQVGYVTTNTGANANIKYNYSTTTF